MDLPVQLAVNKHIWVWVVAAAVAAVLIIGVVWVTSQIFRDTRQDIDLGELGSTGAGAAAMAGYTEATHELCDGVRGCVQAYDSEHVEYYKFDSQQDAAAYADSHGDTFRSNWIVIQYTDEALSPDEQERLEMYIDSIATST